MISEDRKMKEALNREFARQFGPMDGVGIYFAPGRVNLIGEHTDYNGGHVFPCALTIGTYAAARKRNDRKLRFYSMNFPDEGVYESSLDDLVPDEKYGWTNYPKGVIFTFIKRNHIIDCGMDIVIFGNIPNGSGLSSSASLEILTGFILRDLFGFGMDNIELALIGQDSENSYNGVSCGIMDQFASAMGRENQAIFLDTVDLSYEYVPLNLKGMKLVIANTNKKHKLADSAYNERRRECEKALKDLQKAVNIRQLGDLTCQEFEQYKDAISDPVCRKRAKHAVYENQRTIEAVKILKSGDIYRFGQLMKEAHISVSRDYQVTGPELDTLAEEAWKIPGCLGSRMTGGGFGGCTVSIVKDEAVEEFKERVGAAYLKKIGYPADFYILEAGGGPRIVKQRKIKDEDRKEI